MQRVPYEGVSRMQTSLRRKHRDRVVRRGLALIIESDFYATDAGRAHFADQLTSIRYCVQETCSARHALNTRTYTTALVPSAHTDACACQDFDVLYAYLTSANYDFSCAKTTARTLLPLSHPLTHSPPPHAPGRRRPLQELAPQAQHQDRHAAR